MIEQHNYMLEHKMVVLPQFFFLHAVCINSITQLFYLSICNIHLLFNSASASVHVTMDALTYKEKTTTWKVVIQLTTQGVRTASYVQGRI